jgi:hypothetical protein
MKVSVRQCVILAAFGLLLLQPRPASAAEPCKLLTVQEIGQTLGATISPAPLGTTGCMWGSGSQRVSIVLRDASAWPRITAPGPHITKTDVGGLGDAAQFSGMDNIWTLSVKQGASVIVLTVYGAKSPDQQRSVEKSLATIALRRL